MPKGKKRIGLQKDFSTIFEGVWVPSKPHKEEARTEPTAQEQDHAVETPVSDEQDRTPDTPAFNEADQAIETPIPEEQDHAIENPTAREQEPAIETPVSDEEEHTADTAAIDEQEHAGDTAISNEQIREIERIMDSMKCPKDFVCYKSGFKNLCKVKNVGEGKIIECSPENQGPCMYRFTFTGKIFCKCPLRHHIARNLKR